MNTNSNSYITEQISLADWSGSKIMLKLGIRISQMLYNKNKKHGTSGLVLLFLDCLAITVVVFGEHNMFCS